MQICKSILAILAPSSIDRISEMRGNFFTSDTALERGDRALHIRFKIIKKVLQTKKGQRQTCREKNLACGQAALCGRFCFVFGDTNLEVTGFFNRRILAGDLKRGYYLLAQLAGPLLVLEV